MVTWQGRNAALSDVAYDDHNDGLDTADSINLKKTHTHAAYNI